VADWGDGVSANGCWTFRYLDVSPPGRFAPSDVWIPGRFAISLDVSPPVSKLVICDTVSTLANLFYI